MRDEIRRIRRIGPIGWPLAFSPLDISLPEWVPSRFIYCPLASSQASDRDRAGFDPPEKGKKRNMQITLNGKPHETSEGATLTQLIDQLDLTGRRIAVLLDDEVVRKADFESTTLAEGCRVEMITMVGGG